MQAYSATQLVLLPSMSQVSFTTFSLYISIILQIIHLYFHSLKRKKNLFWNASCFNLRFNTHTKLEIPGRFFTANDMTECIRLIMLKNCVRGPENSEWTRDVIFFFIKLCTKYNFVPVNFFGCLEGTYQQKKPYFSIYWFQLFSLTNMCKY